MIGQVDKACVGEVQRKRKSGRKSQYDVRSVDEITKEDLDNIAYRSKDKIWDKENVSHIRHLQCCTILSGFLGSCGFFTVFVCDNVVPSGQLVSPVQTEDSGHQDDLSQWVLCWGQRSVLWAMPEEPLWRGRTRRAARPGQC